MATYVRRTAGERFAQLVAGLFLGFVAYQGFELQPETALILGALGGVLVFMALGKFKKVA